MYSMKDKKISDRERARRHATKLANNYEYFDTYERNVVRAAHDYSYQLGLRMGRELERRRNRRNTIAPGGEDNDR